MRSALGSAKAAVNREALEALVPQLVRLTDDAARSKFLTAHRELAHADLVRELTDLVRSHGRVNTREALLLAEFAVALAHELNDQAALAQSLLAKGGALYGVGEHRASIQHNSQAVQIFRTLGMTTDLARTLNASIQPHILLGEYEQAMAAVEEARAIFQAEGNAWRLARVDANAGNIYHRQDRFAEA